MESIDMGIWDIVLNGLFIPMHAVKDIIVMKTWSDWSKTEKKKGQYDFVVKSIITSALNMDEFYRVSQCCSSKKM